MSEKYRVHEFVRFDYSEIGEYIDEYHTDRPLRNDILVELLNKQDKSINELKYSNHNHAKTIIRLTDKINQLEKENEQLKSTNMGMEDYLGRLEESNINLQIKLQKIRDYAKEDGEVKQGIIEKVILNDWKRITNNKR